MVRDRLDADYSSPDWNLKVVNAFEEVLEGRARIGISDGVPVIFDNDDSREPTMRVLAHMELNKMMTESIHRVFVMRAQFNRFHSQSEIDAMLSWIDNELSLAGVELIQRSRNQYPSDWLQIAAGTPAEENAEALISVIRDLCHLEWRETAAIFHQPPELYRPGDNPRIKDFLASARRKQSRAQSAFARSAVGKAGRQARCRRRC